MRKASVTRGGSVAVRQHQPDEAVVAEAIGHRYRPHQRIAARGGEFRGGAPDAVDVELVGALGQLLKPLQLVLAWLRRCGSRAAIPR